jgi:FixJ family two-component response regulator
MDATKRVVAVVENDTPTLKALERLLRASGYQAEGFHSAETFMARAPDPDVSCLLLDIDLDGMSGLELQKILQGARNAPPIIFVTGNSDEGRRARALEMGCIAFLRKPVSSVALMQALEKALAV